MTKVVNGTTVILETDEKTYVVFTLFYDDGRVITKAGNSDWEQIKEPDIFVLAVGKCKDCGEIIYEDEDWDYHENRQGKVAWVRHQMEEGCRKKEESDDEDN